MYFAFILVFQGLLMPVPQAPAKGASSSLVDTIKAHHQAYLKALIEGDVTAYGKIFTENGMLLFPGEFVQGRSQLEARQQQIFDRIKVLDGNIHTLSVESSGDLAYEVGRFQYTISSKKDRQKVNLSGRFLAIWRKNSNGEWHLEVDSGFPD